ncbi:AI-2E family transporter [Dysosmobacter sp.]|uniref:AI-2E family transporter n=1 Tax=Dysosmobacter sp. TaxID=2591382 RepID=UPI002A877C4B|nr:AI-2E family transporter [Dysosmobacter sp.]MDY3281907.1 AI-2E family transporter [Dysosmobacter sp.]
MEWNKRQLRGWLTVVCGGIAFYTLLQNPDKVMLWLGRLIGVLSPFLLGGTIAFILSVPMRSIERRLFPNARKGARFRRPLALVLTLLAVAGVLTVAFCVIGPGAADALRSVTGQLPGAIRRLEVLTARLESLVPRLEPLLAAVNIDWTELVRKAGLMLQTWGTGLLSSSGGLIGGVVSGVSSFIIGFIFAVYLLMQKEKLARQGRQVLYALLPERWADRTVEVLRLANRTFSSFLSGQCLEACILGGLFVVAMSLLRMPYALLVGVLIALTALIPIIGAFIGCIVGALLIAVTNPWQALMFVVLFLVLQQIEGNLIYPHVVGSSVGLPSIWVLVAVTLGGKLMGVAGMLLFIPLSSVCYALFRRFVKDRLAQRHIPPEKWLSREE